MNFKNKHECLSLCLATQLSVLIYKFIFNNCINFEAISDVAVCHSKEMSLLIDNFVSPINI